MTAMQAKKWVLATQCVETVPPGLKVNLFRVRAGYALPVACAETNKAAMVRACNVSNLDNVKCQAFIQAPKPPEHVGQARPGRAGSPAPARLRPGTTENPNRVSDAPSCLQAGL